MKITYSILALLLCLSTFAQTPPQWVNCTNGSNVQDVFKTETHLWIATTGGIVQRDLATEENTYYNRGNSLLPSNHVRSLVVDKNGLLWVATTEGLANFDGSNWTVFYDRLGLLALNQEGNAVIANDMIIGVWDGQNFIDTIVPENVHYQFISNVIIDPEDGTIWLSYFTFGQYEVAQYKAQSWTFYDHTNSPLPIFSSYNNPMVLDVQGRIWIGNGSGLYRLDENEWAYFDPSTSDFPNGNIAGLARNSDSKIWVIVMQSANIQDAQLVEFTNDSEFTLWPLPDELSTNGLINNLHSFEDSPQVYLGTAQNGLWAYTEETWSNIPSSQSPLPSNIISQVFMDETFPWIHSGRYSTYEVNALFTIEAGEWQFFQNQDIPFSLDTHLPTLLTRGPDGGLWAHRKDSLYLFQDGQWSVPSQPDILPDVDEVNSFIHFTPDGKKWLLEKHHSYLFLINDIGWVSFPHEEHGAVSGNYVAYFNHPITGDFWLASANGISHYDGISWELIKPQEFGGGTNYVNDMVVTDDGVIWFSCSRYLFKMEDNIPTLVNDESTPLHNSIIQGLTLDSEQQLWIGMGSAIAKYDGQNWLVFDNTNSGVPNGRIDHLDFDSENNLWVGSTSGGFSVYNEAGLSDEFWINEHPNSLNERTTLKNACRFYPNPISKGTDLQFQLPDHFLIDSSSQIKGYNTLGQELWSMPITISQASIPAALLQQHSGLSFLKIQNRNGFYTCSMIVE